MLAAPSLEFVWGIFPDNDHKESAIVLRLGQGAGLCGFWGLGLDMGLCAFWAPWQAPSIVGMVVLSGDILPDDSTTTR